MESRQGSMLWLCDCTHGLQGWWHRAVPLGWDGWWKDPCLKVMLEKVMETGAPSCRHRDSPVIIVESSKSMKRKCSNHRKS